MGDLGGTEGRKGKGGNGTIILNLKLYKNLKNQQNKEQPLQGHRLWESWSCPSQGGDVGVGVLAETWANQLSYQPSPGLGR